MNLILEARSNYGQLVLYPASPDAVILAAIAGTKTLTPRVVALAMMTGATVEVIGGQVQAAREEIALNSAACITIGAMDRARAA